MDERILSRGGLLKAALCVICGILLAVSLMPTGAYAASADAMATDATGDQDVGLLADDAESSVWTGKADISWYDPDGTEFTLTSADQLAGLAEITSGTASGYTLDNFKGKIVYLGVDMDLANISWDPISDFNVTSTATWQGTLDGKGHVITNMNVEALATSYGGVRGLIAGIGADGVVRNLGISGTVAGRVCGGIVGATNAFSNTDTNTLAINEWPRIENCWSSVAVTGDGSGRRGSGGIFGGDSNSAGNMYCNIINCYSTGSVSASGGIPVGGLAGVNGAIVAGSYSTASITGTYVGGNVATMYMKGYNSGSYNFTAQGTYVNNMTTTSPAYRYYSGSSGDNGDPTSSDEGVCTAEELADNGVSTLGSSAWVKGITAPYYPRLYWEAGYSDIDITDAATVTVNGDNTVTVTLGDDVLVEYTDYFAVGEGANTVVYGIGRYTGEAKPGTGGTSTWDGNVDTSWYNTTDTSFTLYSAAQLAGLADITSPDCSKAESTDAVVGETESRAEGIKLDNFEGKTVKLAVNVDLNNLQWNPISDFNNWGQGGQGTSNGTFSGVYWQGTFDGGGHIITNMSADGRVNCSTNYWGYQGFISGIGIGGLVRNLGVQGEIHARVAGGIVAASNFDSTETVNMELNEWPRVENCWTNVPITSNGSSTRASGGIFGGERDDRAVCSIINCYSLGGLTTSSGAPRGGISGLTNGIVAGCYSTSSLAGSLTASITTNLLLPSYSHDYDGIHDAYKAVGVFVHNIGLSDPVYRYCSEPNRYDSPTDVDGAVGIEDLQNGVDTLGAHAWVQGTSSTGYPQLYWEAGDSDIDLSDATVTVGDDNSVSSVTLDGGELVEYTDYIVVPGDLPTVYGVGRYTGSAQPKADFTVNVGTVGSTTEPTAVKEYTAASFKALAKQNSDEPVSGLYADDSGWNVVSTDYYITLSDLYEIAGVDEEDIAQIELSSSDGSYTLSVEDLDEQIWFYPKATNDESSDSADGIQVPAVFAMTSNSGVIGEDETAGQVQTTNLENPSEATAPRFINGISEDQFTSKDATEDRLQSNCTSITITIGGVPLGDAEVTVAEGDYVYTGSAFRPNVTVTLDGATLSPDTDYTVAYSDNVNAGSATVTVTGAGQYTGTAKGTFTITPANIADCTIASIDDVKATGSEVEPSLSITDDRYASVGQPGPVLTLGKDYTAAYTDNIDYGTATVTVEGMGNYQGEKDTTFEIIPFFTVYYQAGGDEYDKEGVRQVAQTYNQAEFERLAKSGTDPVSGMFYQNSTWRVTSTDYYVTLEDLFYDAGLVWDEGTVLSYGGEGESYSYSYEVITAQDKFFYDAAGSDSLRPDYYNDAPAVLSIQEYSISTGTVADDGTPINTAQDAQDYIVKYINENKDEARNNEPRMIYGITETAYTSKGEEDNAAGRRYWSRCDHVTLNVEAYTITVATPENGTVKADMDQAALGDTVTLTVTPDPGFEVGSVDVTDADENEVTVTDKGNGIYTFTMPDSAVTVKATFTASEPTKITLDKSMFDVDTSYGIYDGSNPVTKMITSDLKEGVDYTVTYANNTSAGEATITITGIGDYTGELTYTFKIIHYFEDVGATVTEGNNWYFDAVYGMVDLGAITGYNETTFGVGDAMSRAQLVTIMWRYCEPDQYKNYNEGTAKNTTDLPDNPDGTYYTGAVNWAVSQGVVTGNLHEDGTYTFNPDDPVTFEQLASIVARYCLGSFDAAAAYPTTALDNGAFTDKDAVDEFARGPMAWAIDNKLVTGNNNEDGTYTLAPLENVARERATTVLYRSIENGVLVSDK